MTRFFQHKQKVYVIIERNNKPILIPCWIYDEGIRSHCNFKCSVLNLENITDYTFFNNLYGKDYLIDVHEDSIYRDKKEAIRIFKRHCSSFINKLKTDFESQITKLENE